MDETGPQGELDFVKRLPGYLAERYEGWKATDHAENQAWYRRLAEEGQRPRTMVISCSDSRVHVTQLFRAEPGEFFMHRNVANLVPPYEPDGRHHGTSACIEYAVTALKVSNLIVLGHSGCGGAEGCQMMCRGEAPELDEPQSMVGRWLDVLRPGFDRVRGLEDSAAQRSALEHQTVLVSLRNLMTFPYVRAAIEQKMLSLHGLFVDLHAGVMEQYDPAAGKFVAV